MKRNEEEKQVKEDPGERKLGWGWGWGGVGGWKDGEQVMTKKMTFQERDASLAREINRHLKST